MSDVTTERALSIESIQDLDDMIQAAMAWGWSEQIAFIIAMQLKASGISAAQAQAMFYDAERRVQ